MTFHEAESFTLRRGVLLILIYIAPRIYLTAVLISVHPAYAEIILEARCQDYRDPVIATYLNFPDNLHDFTNRLSFAETPSFVS